MTRYRVRLQHIFPIVVYHTTHTVDVPPGESLEDHITALMESSHPGLSETGPIERRTTFSCGVISVNVPRYLKFLDGAIKVRLSEIQEITE